MILMKQIDGLGVAEAPRFHPRWGFLFSDMTHGGVHTFSHLDDSVTVTTLIPHRRAIGGIAVHAAGGLVVTGRAVTWRHGAGLEGRTDLLTPQPDEEFFNDMWTDRAGQIYVGSLGRLDDTGRRPPGRFYRIALDGTPEVIADDIEVSNGITGSPDGRWVYHADTGAQVIWRYRASGGGLAERTEFCDLRGREGAPDGLSIAADATLWVAMAGAGVILHLDERGRAIGELRVGQPLVTGLCFGGDDLTTFAVTTGVLDDGDEGSGSVYLATAVAPGAPAHESRVRPPQAP